MSSCYCGADGTCQVGTNCAGLQCRGQVDCGNFCFCNRGTCGAAGTCDGAPCAQDGSCGPLCSCDIATLTCRAAAPPSACSGPCSSSQQCGQGCACEGGACVKQSTFKAALSAVGAQATSTLTAAITSQLALLGTFGVRVDPLAFTVNVTMDATRCVDPPEGLVTPL